MDRAGRRGQGDRGGSPVDGRARRTAELAAVTDQILASVDQGAGTGVGSGGMYSKLTAARVAAESGIETWLAKGDRSNVLLDISSGKTVGTRIGGGKTP